MHFVTLLSPALVCFVFCGSLFSCGDKAWSRESLKINGGPIGERTIDLPITLVSVDTCVNSFERDLRPCIDTCYSGNASVGGYDYRLARCNLQKE